MVDGGNLASDRRSYALDRDKCVKGEVSSQTSSVLKGVRGFMWIWLYKQKGNISGWVKGVAQNGKEQVKCREEKIKMEIVRT